MPTAYSILSDRFEDGRHRVIEAGLAAAGFRVVRADGPHRSPADVLVTWTVHHSDYRGRAARAWAAGGGRVVVCEEGHLPPVDGEKFFSFCLGEHQAGPWHDGGPSRWASLGIPVAPWRTAGETVLVREQRSIGSVRMASPPGWHDKAAAALRGLTAKRVQVRRHPKLAAVPPLVAALRDCCCFVTWASSEGTRALLAGVPVIWMAPLGFPVEACGRRLEDIKAPPMPDRQGVFERMAWAQWRLAEIATGELFRPLLERREAAA